MGQLNYKWGRWIIALALLAALMLATGCAKTATAVSSATTIDYTGALSTAYDGALDVISQFALGTLKLEGTPDAVTEEQATRLLPLWQALQGGVAQTSAEQSAVIRQIEAAMAQSQVAAIAEMRLTQEAMQTWARDRGMGMPAPGGPMSGTPQPGGQGQPSTGDMATRQARFNQMSDSERATAMAQFGGQRRQQGGQPGQSFGTPRARVGGVGASGSSFLITAVVALLRQRSGQQAVQANPAATAKATIVFMSQTPTATATAWAATPTPEPTQTPTLAPTATPGPSPTVEATPTPTTTPAAPATTPAPTNTPTAARPSAASTPRPTATPQPTYAPALTQIEDKDPGPPFSVEISANQAAVDPLDAQNVIYKVTGLLRNNGSETYSVSAVHVTFFDASGFRGSFYRFPQPWETGGEWVWHGKTEAAFGCLLLAPGETCPFGVEITARNMASFLVHADATATSRQPVPVTLSNLRVTDDGSSYVRITGTATNSNSFSVKNVNVAGTLLDASGQIVSVGSTSIVQTGIAPGGSVSVDLRLAAASYATYRLYAQAERE